MGAAIQRTVVITGASSGLGRALALRYAADATTLGLLGRSSDRLGHVADDCRRLGATVRTGCIDVRARSEMEHWLQQFDAHSPIGILIANAGVMAGRPADANIESSTAGYAVMETNVLGVLNVIQPALPWMMSRGHGQIGIVSSIAAFIPLPDAPSYSASKAAILAYGLALRSALHRSGIGVSVICPGYIKTPMMAQETGCKPFAMPPERAAALIVRGLQRNCAIIEFPRLFALVTRFGGLMPDYIRRWTVPRFAVDPRQEPDF
ncbi:MAG: SDR family NAD(P)-dependent oxidoreductase [Xanthobacteraceae bacterium]